MSKSHSTTLICDVCDKIEEHNSLVTHLPINWDYATIAIGPNESSKFLVCYECRSKVYKDKFFSKIWNKVFNKGS